MELKEIEGTALVYRYSEARARLFSVYLSFWFQPPPAQGGVGSKSWLLCQTEGLMRPCGTSFYFLYLYWAM
jgi:hypothetical protein